MIAEMLICEVLVTIEPWSSFERRWFMLAKQKIDEILHEKKKLDRRRNQKTGRFEK